MSSGSPLRATLERAASTSGLSLTELTVLDKKNDTFRLDTPARHRDGHWLAETVTALGLPGTIHLRGLHYAIIGRPKPDGSPYQNTDAEWQWLVDDAAKAARWLGYLEFERIVDHRNDAPTIIERQVEDPWPYISVGVDVHVPSIEDMEPQVEVLDFTGAQSHKLVIVGEKSSLTELLTPIAERYAADLYLPAGEISDTLIHRMATVAAADGRPMVVAYVSDCDPSGWQMPISVARKLQALATVKFPGLQFEVHRAGLTPAQVRELDMDLPASPVKSADRRAQAWRDAMGMEQTEIDALVQLHPQVLTTLIEDVLDPYFDHGLASRVAEARLAWRASAQAALNSQLDQRGRESIRAAAEPKLAELEQQIEAINNSLRVSVDDVDLPPLPPVPDPQPAGGGKRPLVSSTWSFAEQTTALTTSRSYAGGGHR